ncbi:MAG: hypothetical protein QF408_01795, partial [Pirellulales bacterium]|nr:hypothetical protein [Pirellulales bacterium]
PMVRVVVAARTNRVSACLPLIVSDYSNGYLLGGDGRRPLCHQTLLAAQSAQNSVMSKPKDVANIFHED